MILKSKAISSELKSYRPISVTACLARLFERMVLARLQLFLEKNKLLMTNQSGFRKCRSTKDNLKYLTQKAQQAFNNNENTHAIFFDVASAFDKVWHHGLAYKLSKIKVTFYLLRIIINFLENRQFYVQIGDYKTSMRSIECGVPQGAVLSPTLFSVFINDVPTKNTQNEKTILFADDIAHMTIYRKGQPITNTVQKYLHELEIWMNKWRHINASK